MACDQACRHCGTRAGRAREDELETRDARRAIHQMAASGVREITLMGGEAYLRKDWLELIRTCTEAGIECGILSGGRQLTQAMVREIREAGATALHVSIDGLASRHDGLRGVRGSFESALRVLRLAADAGLSTGVNTQLGPGTLAELPELHEHLRAAGAGSWRIGFLKPLGEAALHPELLLEPFEFAEIVPALASYYDAQFGRSPLIQVDDSFPYFGPRDIQLRAGGNPGSQWCGCPGGCNAFGIDSCGTVKVCTSLPDPEYGLGNLKHQSFEEIWSGPTLHAYRDGKANAVFGFCATCYYASLCQGGCPATSQAVYGRPGNDPYCYHRVEELARQGLCERLGTVRRDFPAPYRGAGCGTVLSRLDGTPISLAEPVRDRTRERAGSKAIGTWDGRPLEPCGCCQRHVFANAVVCPFCETDMARARHDREASMAHLRTLEDALKSALRGLMTGDD